LLVQLRAFEIQPRAIPIECLLQRRNDDAGEAGLDRAMQRIRRRQSGL
jgi:hypothetical protein